MIYSFLFNKFAILIFWNYHRRTTYVVAPWFSCSRRPCTWPQPRSKESTTEVIGSQRKKLWSFISVQHHGDKSYGQKSIKSNEKHFYTFFLIFLFSLNWILKKFVTPPSYLSDNEGKLLLKIFDDNLAVLEFWVFKSLLETWSQGGTIGSEILDHNFLAFLQRPFQELSIDILRLTLKFSECVQNRSLKFPIFNFRQQNGGLPTEF